MPTRPGQRTGEGTCPTIAHRPGPRRHAAPPARRRDRKRSHWRTGEGTPPASSGGAGCPPGPDSGQVRAPVLLLPTDLGRVGTRPLLHGVATASRRTGGQVRAPVLLCETRRKPKENRDWYLTNAVSWAILLQTAGGRAGHPGLPEVIVRTNPQGRGCRTMRPRVMTRELSGGGGVYVCCVCSWLLRKLVDRDTNISPPDHNACLWKVCAPGTGPP